MKQIAAILAVSMALAASGLAKDKKPETPPPAPTQPMPAKQPGTTQPRTPMPGMDMNTMMADYAKMMAPGEEHKALGKMVGKWNLKITMTMPGAPPHESAGTSEFHWILDGHYMEEDATGDMMGSPFKGMNIIGYDKFRKQYVSCWIDNMSTGLGISSGFHDMATNSTTMMGQMDDPMTGSIGKWSTSIIKTVDDDHCTMEMHDPSLGANSKVMQIDYTRVK